jgi:hypothetical protein
MSKILESKFAGKLPLTVVVAHVPTRPPRHIVENVLANVRGEFTTTAEALAFIEKLGAVVVAACRCKAFRETGGGGGIRP